MSTPADTTIGSQARSLHHVEAVMGTSVSFDVRTPLPTTGSLQAAIDWLHLVDEVFSTYRPDSDICRIGRGELDLNDAHPDVGVVLRTCIELQRRTGGSFDIWSLTERHGSTLDPSGYVKGWAIERAADLLVAAGAENLCINAGGDIAVRGTPTAATPWRVGIRDPLHADRTIVVVTAIGRTAIATSATYERGAHIIDPRCGQPALGPASVTVIGPDLGLADAYATAVFVSGSDGLAWIEQIEGYDAMIIEWDRSMTASSGFCHHVAPTI